MLTSAWLQNGQLWIEGTDGSDNIEIRFERDQISIANTPILTEFGDYVDSVSRTSVPQQVVVHALDGDDVVRAVEIGVVASPSLTVLGGWGNDRLTGSSGHDHLLGEGGNDELSGLAGDDTLSGGIGSDRFDGASGWDSVVETNLLDATLEDSRLQTTRLNRYPLQGDTNHDDRIDLMDLNNVRNNFGSSGHGDANGDGLVNVHDLNLVRNRFGATWEESSIVEFENTDEALVSIEGGNLAASHEDTAGVVLNASTFSGQVVLQGAWGSDILIGGHGSDELHGGDGHDLLVGGNGDDLIYGGAGHDKLVGCHDGWAVEIGGADDRLYGDDGDDEIWGGEGNDLLVGGNGNDVAHGEVGNDKLVGCHDGWAAEVGGADDRLYGDDGDDEIWGGDGNDLLVGGNGNDLAFGESGNDKLVGCHDGLALETNGADDRLHGDDGDDEIWGGDGNDLLVGGNGNDVAHGESGNDKLVGCHDGLALETGGADDRLYGDDGDDEIWGGDGNDLLVGGNGNDVAHGEGGNDKLVGCHDGWAVETGGADDRLFGDDGNDEIWGGDGNDTIFGGVGNDDIRGELGNDFLSGEAGDDTLFGGGGSDAMIGGDGADIANDGVGFPIDQDVMNLGSSVNLAFHNNHGTLLLQSDEGSTHVTKLNTNELTAQQQEEVLDRIIDDAVKYLEKNGERILNGEIKAADVGGYVYGFTTASIAQINNQIDEPIIREIVNKAIVASGTQQGRYWGTMVDQIFAVIKGEDTTTLAEVAGTLAVVQFVHYAYLGNVVYSFGADGWELTRQLGRELGGVMEEAVHVMEDAVDEVFDIFGDAGEFIEDVFDIF